MKNFDKDAVIKALQDEVDTLRTILGMMPGNLYWRSTDGLYLGSNTNMAQILQFTSTDKIIGKSPIDFMTSEEAEKVDIVDFEVVRTQKEVTTEEQGYDQDGKSAIYLTRKSPYYDRQGKVQGILGISFDITDRKLMEEKLQIAKEKAEAANRSKSQFLAMISHELRTPLTSIIGFANFIKQKKLSVQQHDEYLNHILNSGYYLLSLINSLLDYNKLENNKFELDPRPIRFKNLIQTIVTMVSAQSQLKKLALDLIYDENIPEILMVDDKTIQQVLINLLGNAIKFTKEGGVTLKLKCIEICDGIAEIKVSVKDTGIGIPASEKKAIFKRFYQLENVYTRSESLSGTGLGLAIVKELLSLLNSKIAVKSEPDVGSNFYFTLSLPVVQAAALEADKIENTCPLAPKVLLVEDDLLIQIIHKQMLEELNCKVNVVENASQSLSSLKSEQDYDIIFVDIGLPDMPGIELIKEIRKKYQSMKDMPIVVLTGYSEQSEYQKCLAAGANELVVKPVSQEKLKEIIKRLL